jgi:hypothetical protein
MRSPQTARTERPARPLPARLAGAAAAVGALLALLSPAASAGTFDVEVCTPQSLGQPGIVMQEDPGTLGIVNRECSTPPVGGLLQGNGGFSRLTGGVRWFLDAAPNTTILSLRAVRTLSDPSTWDSGLVWNLAAGPNEEFMLEHAVADGSPLPTNGPVFYAVESSTLTSHLFCPKAECEGKALSVRLSEVIARMEDDFAPELAAAPGGSLLAGGPLRGTKAITFSVLDKGAGISDLKVLLDGKEIISTLPDTNGGRCARPFVFVQPCVLSLSGSIPVDTETLPDGRHEVRLAVLDPANNQTLSAPVTIVIHNAPSLTQAPVLSGAAKLGGELTVTPGAWEGVPTSFAYQWLRCPASVVTTAAGALCTPIPGATAPRYSPAAADVFQRDIARVTATNAHGSESAFSNPSGIVPDAAGRTAPDTTAPVLSAVSLSPARFRVGRASTALSARRAGAGAVLRFTSSEDGQLSVAIERALPGMVGPKRVCQPRRGRAGGRRCTLHRSAGALSRELHAGPGRIRFSGRVGAKRLVPGRYRMTLTATDAAGNASAPARVQFTVLPG